MLLESIDELLTVNEKPLTLVALKHVKVDEVGVILVFSEQIKLFFRLTRPRLAIFIEVGGHLPHSGKTSFNQLLVF